MSQENAKEFLKEFRGNSVFRASIENAADDGARQQLARDAGYDFTREEMTQVMGVDATKISDSDLEAVAGGSSAAWVGAGAAVVGAAAAAGA